MFFGSGSYKRVIATAERSGGNESVGDMWIETKTFDRKTPIEDIVHWANMKQCSGKLIITLDETDA
mgnify:CR=1 FL=1